MILAVCAGLHRMPAFALSHAQPTGLHLDMQRLPRKSRAAAPMRMSQTGRSTGSCALAAREKTTRCGCWSTHMTLCAALCHVATAAQDLSRIPVSRCRAAVSGTTTAHWSRQLMQLCGLVSAPTSKERCAKRPRFPSAIHAEVVFLRPVSELLRGLAEDKEAG